MDGPQGEARHGWVRPINSRLTPPLFHHRPPTDDQQNRLEFFLDPDSSQYRSILEMAEGTWYIDDRPADRPAGWTRVYMSATVKVNSLVPLWLVEYAAERALKRATAWLKPYVEQRTWEKKERLQQEREREQQQRH